MKRTFTFFCALLLGYFACAQQNSNLSLPATDNIKAVVAENKSQVAAEVIFLKETEYDFGKIPQGKPVTHVFYFTNAGTTPLSLENVQTSCGCTTPEWSKESVPAGSSSKITVGYNAMSEGSFTKMITINYNGNQAKQIIIKGEVWKTPDSSAPANEALNSLKNQ